MAGMAGAHGGHRVARGFTEAELLLLEDLRHWNVPFFMVRNKIDAWRN